MDVAEPWLRTAERKSSRTGGDRKQILYLFMKVVTGNFHFTTFDDTTFWFSQKSQLLARKGSDYIDDVLGGKSAPSIPAWSTGGQPCLPSGNRLHNYGKSPCY